MKKVKQITESFLDYIIRVSNKIKKNLQIEEHEEDLNITHLNAVKLDIDEISNYTKVIKWGVDQGAVKNIALTGSYGTGKSSILKSFIDFYDLKNTLTISLANFEISDISNEVIEYNIVNQIIYSEKSNKLKDSRFKRIQYVKYKWFKTLLIFIFVYSIIYLFFDNINNLISLFDSYLYTVIFFKSFFLLGILLIIYTLYNEIVNFRISKVSPTDIEISKENNERDSILSQYFDEILNFFYKTKTNVVFIEDLDRFDNSIQVFTKLREINELLNSSKELKCRKITFIYAIKDEFIENSHDKTKFFDLIIPILPFINYNTSREFIFDKLSKIDNNFKNNHLLKELIKDTSIYINDTRTALNIINEFVIMKNQYNKHWNENKLSNQDIYKIFALSIYKNCYSKDFAFLLENNQNSIFYSIILKKDLFLQKQIDEYEDEIRNFQSNISKVQDEHFTSVEELNMLFVHQLMLQLSTKLGHTNLSNIIINNEDITLHNLHEIEHFETIFKDINYKLHHDSFRKSNIRFQNLESSLKINYNDRIDVINNKIGNKIKDLNKKIEQKKTGLAKLKAKPIKELLKRIDNSGIIERINIDKGSFKNIDLLFLLIKSGYIDETYLNYISYKHSGLLDIEDLIFRNRIQNNEVPEPLKKINNIEILLNDLSLNNFNNKTIFNYNILEYLLHHQKQFSEQIDIFFRNINEQPQLSKDFVLDAISHLEKRTSLMFFTKIFEDNSLWNIVGLESNDKTNKILSLMLDESNIDVLKIRLEQLNVNNKLLEYLNVDNSIINLQSTQLIMNLNNLFNYKISSFIAIENNKSITEFVYNNNLYVLNQNNFQFVISNILREKTIQYDLNYLQLKLNSTKLYEYIKDEMDTYLEDIYFSNVNQENNTSDEIKKLIFFNKENVSHENEIRFIKDITFKIDLFDLTENDQEIFVEPELIRILTKENRLHSNWKTIKELKRKSIGLTDLYSFINKNILSLSSDKYTFKDNSLIIDLVKSSEVNDYTIFDMCEFSMTNIEEVNKSEDFIGYIIEKGKIELTQDNFDILIPSLQIKFIEKYNKKNDSFKNIEFNSGETSNILMNSSDDVQRLMTSKMLNNIDIIEFTNIDVVIRFLDNIIKYEIKTVSLSIYRQIFKSTIDKTKKIEFLNYILLNNLVQNIKEINLFVGDIEGLKNITLKKDFKCDLTEETRILFPLLRKLKIIKMEYISEKQKHITVKF